MNGVLQRLRALLTRPTEYRENADAAEAQRARDVPLV
uniref:Protein-L-isoaspartate O-methyltransferase n=1 Tax=Ascaris lumbricoides TaxID=6252 RepID=A0A0M3ICT2_ASCLU